MVLLDVYRLLILVEMLRLIPFNRILNSFDSTRNIPNELVRWKGVNTWRSHQSYVYLIAVYD